MGAGVLSHLSVLSDSLTALRIHHAASLAPSSVLASLPHLRELQLQLMIVSISPLDVETCEISSLQHLEGLGLSCPGGIKGLRALACLPCLTHVDLDAGSGQPAIGGDELRHLADLPALQSLAVKLNQGPSNMSWIQALTALTALSVTVFGPVAPLPLLSSSLKRLSFYDLSPYVPTLTGPPSAFFQVTRLKALQHLVLFSRSRILPSPEGLLLDISTSLRRLTSLTLNGHGLRGISQDGVQTALKRLRYLHHISLPH